MADQRILELTEVTTVSSDQNIPLDSSVGTRRITMANFIDDTLTASGKPADAKAVGDAISAETTARQAAEADIDTALGGKADAADLATLSDDVADLKQDLSQNYARTDGYYETLTAGQAEQVLSTTYVEDKVPYNFRTSGGSADIGDRSEEMLVGGTVAWNQRFESALGRIAANSGTITFDSSARLYTIICNDASSLSFGFYGTNATLRGALANHVHFLMATVKVSADSVVRFGIDNRTISTNLTADAYTRVEAIVKPTENRNFVCYTNGAQEKTMYAKDIMNFDLTAMFGSAIADYIYTLESTTPGAGIAKLRSWGFFTKDYYPYCAPTLESVQAGEKEVVGFNAWDEEWELGWIDASGTDRNDANIIRSKNYISVLPNTAYCINFPNTGTVNYYDANKVCLGQRDKEGKADITTGNFVRVMPSDCHYIRIWVKNQATYNHDIAINLSWSGYRNGEYEPYKKITYPLDSTLTLRGIPKIDASGNLYYDGDTYEADGTVTRRYGVVDLGTLTWSKRSTSTGHFRFTANTDIYIPSSTTIIPNITCPKYSTITPADSWTGVEGVSCNTSAAQILISDENYEDAAAFKAAMSGVYLVYELATPTTETAEPYTTPQWVDDFGTERITDYAFENGDRDVEIPAGHETKYLTNLRDKIQHLPDLADADGYYVIQQTGHQMELVHFRIPQAPTANGTYVLKATVSGGVPTYTWEVVE